MMLILATSEGWKRNRRETELYASPLSLLLASRVAESLLPVPPYSSTKLPCTLKKRGKEHDVNWKAIWNFVSFVM